MQISFNSKNEIEGAPVRKQVLGKPFSVKPEGRHVEISDDKNEIIAEGDFYYFHDKESNFTEYLANKSDKDLKDFLSAVVKKRGWDYCREHLEGNYNAVVFNADFFQIQGDKFKQRELFYLKDDAGFFASSSLSEIVSKRGNGDYNQEAIVLIMASHYQYCPARETIYKGVYSLGPNEFIEYSKAGFRKFTKWDFKEIEEYGENKLQEYGDILNRAILGRADANLNIANSTGGWDSTYIISVLVDLLGKDKVGSSLFGYLLDDGKIWNVYERDKAEKVAEFFGIKYTETQINLNSYSFLDSLDELFRHLNAKGFYVNCLHHFLMYKKLKEEHPGAGTIFSGEASDGLHNFGFTHWRGFFHESYPIKEYGDKMKNYMYGPQYFNKLKNNQYRADIAFKFWKDISGNIDDVEYNPKEHRNFMFKYMAPLTLGQARMPFENIFRNKNITQIGKANLLEKLENDYFAEIIENINDKNIYSSLIWIYKLFHFQGPTFKMLSETAGCHGFKMAIPFLDSNVAAFLEKMPADWGRGLEFRKTKYPIKALAAKRNFPYKLVDSGIHSFPSEVDPSLKDETYHFYFNSPATNYFKEKLLSRKYKEILNEEYFNLPFIEKEVDAFLSGKMTAVSEPDSLMRLINLVSIGWRK